MGEEIRYAKLFSDRVKPANNLRLKLFNTSKGWPHIGPLLDDLNLLVDSLFDITVSFIAFSVYIFILHLLN